jgi:hypothetical protein
MSRQTISGNWKQERLQEDKNRAVVESLYDEAEEYVWTDQYEHEENPLWIEGQQINFKVGKWTPENTAGRPAKKTRIRMGQEIHED